MAKFRGNPFLKGKNVKYDWTPELIEEYIKCKEDIYYFINTYFKIVTEDGLVNMTLRPYQREMIDNMLNGRFTLACMSRQSGKTETLRAFLIWYILFNDYKTVAIVANKLDTAMEIIGKLQISYQNLPLWLQLGVTEFNKGSFVLENNSRLFASATSKDALRGYTCHIIVIDEAAHIENWDEFYGAVSPTISAGKTTKLVMVSTPNGLNHFYDFYEGSSLGRRTNSFNATFVRWDDVPGRDEEWQRQILELINFDHVKFDQEYNCSFIGSSGTLISGHRLQTLKLDIKPPIHVIDDKLKIYEAPVKERKDWREVVEKYSRQDSIYMRPDKEEGQIRMEEYIIPANKYAIVADVSRGKGLDYSAFSVIDITKVPYRQVATFRDNNITPTDYAHYLYKVGQLYNEAIVLVEINDIGEQVSTYMMDELQYENVLCTQSNGRAGKTVSFNLSKADKGVRTTITLKNSGCLLMKLLLEECRLEVCDSETIGELMTFVKDKNSWSAEKGKHDDLVMGIVLFSWLSDQKFFLEWTSINTVASLTDMPTSKIEQNLLNFGYIARDTTDHTDLRGQKFQPVHNMNIPFGKIENWEDYTPPTLYLNNF
jgi:Terminase large subunit, T4likevirus-type, N-terminal/Terminase RNaseH-like domain